MPTKSKKKTGKKGGAVKSAKKDPKAKKAAAKGKKGAAAKKPKAAKKDPKAAKAKGGAKGGAKGSKKKDSGKKGSDKKAKGGKNKKSYKQQEEEKEAEAKAQGHDYSASRMVDTGPDIILPASYEFVTEMDPLTITPLMDDDNVEDLTKQFEDLERLLRQRKKDCMLRARILVAREDEDTPPICIDIAGMKNVLSNVGLPKGENAWNVECRRQGVLDKGNELLAHEAKFRGVTKTREKTSKEYINGQIAECKEALNFAEPILKASKEALSKISKSALDEIRALPNPHKLLIKTVKACAIMAGKKESELDSWGNVKKLLKTAFITEMLEFEARNITDEIVEILESAEYLGKDGVEESDQVTVENVTKANAVAGNLVVWLEAQLKYHEFLPKVEPELARLAELNIDLQGIDGKIDKLETALAALTKSIDKSKGEFRENGRAFNQAMKELNACD